MSVPLLSPFSLLLAHVLAVCGISCMYVFICVCVCHVHQWRCIYVPTRPSLSTFVPRFITVNIVATAGAVAGAAPAADDVAAAGAARDMATRFYHSHAHTHTLFSFLFTPSPARCPFPFPLSLSSHAHTHFTLPPPSPLHTLPSLPVFLLSPPNAKSTILNAPSPIHTHSKLPLTHSLTLSLSLSLYTERVVKSSVSSPSLAWSALSPIKKYYPNPNFFSLISRCNFL